MRHVFSCLQFHLEEEIPGLLRDMTAAAEQAASVNPKPGDLKVTLNIGNTTQVASSCFFTHTAEAPLQCSYTCHFATLWSERKCSSAESCAVCIVLCALCCVHCAVCIVLCALCCVNTVTCCRLTDLLCWEDNASASTSVYLGGHECESLLILEKHHRLCVSHSPQANTTVRTGLFEVA